MTLPALPATDESREAPRPLASLEEGLPLVQEGEEAAPLETAQAAESPKPVKPRLVALDAWRGLTILLMLLVNNIALGDYTPAQLVHAPWGGGMTLTDLVFPWFLYCAGASLPFSLGRKPEGAGWPLDAETRRTLLERTVKMYLVGAALTSLENHRLTLGLGVLQLIALASLCAGLLARLSTRHRLLVALGLLLVYQVFLLTAPFTEADNAVTRLNALVFSHVGLSGLTSVLPATALVLLGSVAAQPLRDRQHEAPRLVMLGLALCLAGALLSLLMDYNKTVWTPSYILQSAGLGTLGLLLMYLIGDTGEGRWARLLAPLTIAGRNSLFAYVFPIAFKLTVLSWLGALPALLAWLQQTLGGVAGGWVYSLGYVGAVWLVLWLLWRRNYIWKL